MKHVFVVETQSPILEDDLDQLCEMVELHVRNHADGPMAQEMSTMCSMNQSGLPSGILRVSFLTIPNAYPDGSEANIEL